MLSRSRDSVLTIIDTQTGNDGKLYGVTGYKVNITPYKGYHFMIIGTQEHPITPYIATDEILIPLNKTVTILDKSFRIIPVPNLSSINTP